jgi:hypothetical protein
MGPAAATAAERGGGGGARFVRLAGLTGGIALERIRQALWGGEDAGGEETLLLPADSEAALFGHRWLLLLDGVDELAHGEATAETLAASSAIWHLLAEALSSSRNLCLLITSRRPRYDAPLPCKVVAYEVPELAHHDAAKLFTSRVHRPLFQRDFDSSADAGTAAGTADPLAREVAQQRLVDHPLLAKVGGSPGDVLAAAAEVTPQLPSLLAHSWLRAAESGGPESLSVPYGCPLPDCLAATAALGAGRAPSPEAEGGA